MNEKEAERMAREFCAGVAVAIIEQQVELLAALVAHMTPEHGQRLIAAMERYRTARHALIPPELIAPGTDARN